MSARLGVMDLGHRPYAEALELQRALCRRRMAGELQQDLLLLVEHEPVVTLGRGARASSLPLAPEELERRGVAVAEVERGGDLLSLGTGLLRSAATRAPRTPRYLRQLEAVLIRCRRLGIAPSGTRPHWRVDARAKIATSAFVKQWVTHGFALNVSTDLRGFDPDRRAASRVS
jgi:lipoate-protein ligase B